MKYLSIQMVLRMQEKIIERTGGAKGIRDMAGLESAIALPQMEMFGNELYPTLHEKAGILGFSTIINHPFMDGNKRIGHAVIDAFLIRNGFQIHASVPEQERIILQVAAGEMTKEAFTAWLETRISKL